MSDPQPPLAQSPPQSPSPQRCPHCGQIIGGGINALTDDEWFWLSWFLGIGAGAYAKETPLKRALVLQRSIDVMNKLQALRKETLPLATCPTPNSQLPTPKQP